MQKPAAMRHASTDVRSLRAARRPRGEAASRKIAPVSRVARSETGRGQSGCKVDEYEEEDVRETAPKVLSPKCIFLFDFEGNPERKLMHFARTNSAIARETQA